ncbi:MAG: DNA repair protein RecO, partial [Prevotellaceae bacterium]|nr:DNA repair protein RecO [Prevotellaceae bacterium]
MQEKTSGIVLHNIKYSDSTSIVTIYTRRFGRAVYMVYGRGKKKSLCRPAFLQPLTLVELDVAHFPRREVQQIKDIRIATQLNNIPVNPVKNALALFLSEILFRTLIRADSDEQLFEFIEQATLSLNGCENSLANFHLVFLLKLTRYLGFEPNYDNRNFAYFDLLEGVFLLDKPLHDYFLDTKDS